eukprot:12719623-Ditylum_brightwellii.AAC.1
MQKEYIFVWDHSAHQVTFQHSESCLPELAINNGFNSFKTYCSRFRQMVNNTVFHTHTSVKNPLPTDSISKEQDFEQPNYVTDNEDSDIEELKENLEEPKTRESHHIQDAPITSDCDWHDGDNGFDIGDKAIFLGENDQKEVVIMGYDTVDSEIKYVVKFKNGHQMQTDESNLRQRSPDLANIPETAEDYARELQHLTTEE